MMTWNELYMVIHEKGLNDKDFLHDHVTIYDAAVGEYYPAEMLEICEATDVLDEGHLFISINVEDS